ncbi:ermin [Bufo bufo]|uniref:ermin n=1 Tax=Bufo bufo TaxID=8384 RepID=UPI001ABDD70E|nr:ermin [Bufo bufo]
MAEEAQAPEYHDNEEPEIIPVQITDVIDQTDTSIVCEVNLSGSPDILNEDKHITPAMDLNDKNEEEQKGENSNLIEKVPDVLDNHEKKCEDYKDGGCQITVDVDGDTVPLPSPEAISREDNNQDGDKAETPDILLYQESFHPSDTGTEDVLTETEEENTSIETDTEYDDQENGPQQPLSVSPSGRQLDPNEMAGGRPDISRNSYSKYDTVSYRKIRKGNTKQRIDEFESMVNL